MVSHVTWLNKQLQYKKNIQTIIHVVQYTCPQIATLTLYFDLILVSCNQSQWTAQSSGHLEDIRVHG